MKNSLLLVLIALGTLFFLIVFPLTMEIRATNVAIRAIHKPPAPLSLHQHSGR